MKATSKIKTAPPQGGVGGGAYSREISSHVYAPQLFRKQRVKRDIGTQFLLASVCSDEVSMSHRQSNRIADDGTVLPVPNAVGKARAKSVGVTQKWNNYVHSSITPDSTILDGRKAVKIMEKIALQKAERIARENHAREMALANARTVASLHVKRVAAKFAKRAVAPSSFSMANAFAGL